MAATSESCSSARKWRKLLCILILVYLLLTFIGGILFVRIEGECQPLKQSLENPEISILTLDETDPASDVSSSNLDSASKNSFPSTISDNIFPRSLPFLRLHLFCREINHPNYMLLLKTIAANGTKELHETLTSICQDYTHVRRDVNQRLDNCTIWTMENFITWSSFASSTIFTIGNGYVVPTTTRGIVLVIIYCLFGMPIALSMLAIGSKLLIHYLSVFISFVETKCLKIERYRRSNGKIMLLLFLVLFVWLILGSAITSDDAMNGLPWLVSLYYWFQSVTTIGQIPYRVKMYEGWRLSLLVPYNIIFFGGLVTVVAMLTLCLNSIMQWTSAECCCVKDDNESEQGDEEDEEEDTSCGCLLDEEVEEMKDNAGCFIDEKESKKPLLSN